MKKFVEKGKSLGLLDIGEEFPGLANTNVTEQMNTQGETELMEIQALTARMTEETEKIIVGKTRQIRLILTAVLADGHILLYDLPGVGKITLVKTLSKVLGCDSRRI